MHVRTSRALEARQLQAVRAMVQQAEQQGAPALNDHLRTDLDGAPRPGFVAALAHDERGLAGYAQASAGNDGFVVDSVVPASTAHPEAMRQQLLTALLDDLPRDAAVTWWTHGDADAAGLAAHLGLQPGRALLQMRCALPLPDALVQAHAVPTRPFVVGADEAAWLEVNNAAFAWHGEQGGWNLETLQQRERAPWFRPDGFLLHEREGRLAAFCWTKLHGDVGEIYVIAVHPHFHGLGLGKALTIAGLVSLREAGATAGMLYVDADNTSAVAMYHALGFSITHTDQAFSRPTGGINP